MVKPTLLWLLLSAAAVAQDLRVTFHTRPEGAAIRVLSAQQETKLSGLSGQPVTLQRNWLAQPRMQVTFSKDGFQTQTEQVPTSELINGGEWPPRGRPPLMLTSAAAPQLSIRINSQPQGAAIYLANSSQGKGQYLGITGTNLIIEKQALEQSTIFLRLEKDGYEPLALTMLAGQFVNGAELPSDGPARLYQTWEGWFKQWGPALAGLLACAVGGAVFLVRRSRKKAWQAPRPDPVGAPNQHEAALRDQGYELLGELGRGGMAVVFEARRTGSDAPLALKLLHREVGLDSDAINRMRREIKVMRELQHPTIVPLYDFGDVNGQYFLVMEKVDGQSLKRRLLEGRLSQEEAVRFIHMLLQGVTYAHNKDIVHRDLKPDNIMLRPDGRLQILDFGISRSTTANTFETMDNSVLGTPAYMAPERFSGVANKASDQYALGLIFYELLCGVAPVPNDIDIAQIITKQLFEVPPEPSTVDADVPKSMDFLVMTMIAKDPVKRFPSMDAALEQFYKAFPAMRPVSTPVMPGPH
ncbi:MAG: protein kinase [Candidatus Eremiobacteraeota bacterium]|nr:protein kinase [Candidatus Eremiobacteraeota bacterium]MCW5872059.1 protein kinase [Candidatus Eremiobacteraeota bacterium]